MAVGLTVSKTGSGRRSEGQVTRIITRENAKIYTITDKTIR